MFVDGQPSLVLLSGEYDGLAFVKGLLSIATADASLHAMGEDRYLTEILNAPLAGDASEHLETFFANEEIPEFAPLLRRLQTPVGGIEDERGLRMKAGEVVVHAAFGEGRHQTVRGFQDQTSVVRTSGFFRFRHTILLCICHSESSMATARIGAPSDAPSFNGRRWSTGFGKFTAPRFVRFSAMVPPAPKTRW